MDCQSSPLYMKIPQHLATLEDIMAALEGVMEAQVHIHCLGITKRRLHRIANKINLITCKIKSVQRLEPCKVRITCIIQNQMGTIHNQLGGLNSQIDD